MPNFLNNSSAAGLDGINSFLLNAILICGSVKAFKGDEKVTGISLGTVGALFYLGNVFGGVSSVEKYNHEENKRIIGDAHYGVNRDDYGVEGITFSLLDFIFAF